MSDLISRSEVWKAFISRVDSICDLEDVRETLDSIPTIEERKEGEWNFIGWNQFECTCCGYPYTQEQLQAVTTRNDQIFPHFCPNCGARMEESR